MARAQVTLFIIFAVLLVLGLLVARVYRGPDQALVAQSFDSRVLAVKQHVQSCVDQTAEDALFLFGMQGGSIFAPLNLMEGSSLPPSTIRFADYDVAILQYLDVNVMPSMDFFERYQLSEYVRLTLPRCVDVRQFSDLNITLGNVNASSIIRNESVSFSVVFPVHIARKEQEARFDQFAAQKDVRLGFLLTNAALLINSAKYVEGSADATLLASLGAKVVRSEDSTTLIYLLADESTIRGQPYLFTFGARVVQ